MDQPEAPQQGIPIIFSPVLVVTPAVGRRENKYSGKPTGPFEGQVSVLVKDPHTGLQVCELLMTDELARQLGASVSEAVGSARVLTYLNNHGTPPSVHEIRTLEPL